jgi:catechol 2,3-dioxygenase-like lactoylglutathione lyase family enzyme
MAPDERPALWVGHVAMPVRDPRRAHEHYVALGMRSVFAGDDLEITELRGGTHLVLYQGEPTPGDAPFDLMVEDLDATHALLSGAGVDVSAISRGDIHDRFTITDPDGMRVTCSNSHVIGPV